MGKHKIVINVTKSQSPTSSPIKTPLCTSYFKFPIFAMIIFCHYLIIIAICYGCIEAAEITMENIANFQVISFPGVFLSARTFGFELLHKFLSILAK